MPSKLCVCQLDDTLSPNANDGGPSSLDGFRKEKKKKGKKYPTLTKTFDQGRVQHGDVAGIRGMFYWNQIICSYKYSGDQMRDF